MLHLKYLNVKSPGAHARLSVGAFHCRTHSGVTSYTFKLLARNNHYNKTETIQVAPKFAATLAISKVVWFSSTAMFSLNSESLAKRVEL